MLIIFLENHEFSTAILVYPRVTIFQQGIRCHWCSFAGQLNFAVQLSTTSTQILRHEMDGTVGWMEMYQTLVQRNLCFRLSSSLDEWHHWSPPIGKTIDVWQVITDIFSGLRPWPCLGRVEVQYLIQHGIHGILPSDSEKWFHMVSLSYIPSKYCRSLKVKGAEVEP